MTFVFKANLSSWIEGVKRNPRWTFLLGGTRRTGHNSNRLWLQINFGVCFGFLLDFCFYFCIYVRVFNPSIRSYTLCHYIYSIYRGGVHPSVVYDEFQLFNCFHFRINLNTSISRLEFVYHFRSTETIDPDLTTWTLFINLKIKVYVINDMNILLLLNSKISSSDIYKSCLTQVFLLVSSFFRFVVVYDL